MICLFAGGVSLLSSWVIPNTADAYLSHFSRANCINNESISWDPFLGGHWLWVNSYHAYGGYWQHCENDLNNACISNYWEWGNHNGGIHWGEGTGGWYVLGYHWWADESTDWWVTFKATWTENCFSNG